MDLHGLLIVDKPRGFTSHDIVGRVRRLLRTKRVGHAGTLDPAAEGVLILAVGRATRLLDRLQDAPKQYAAHIVLGVETDTADIDGRIIGSGNAQPGQQEIESALQLFRGTIEQVPPAHSAIKLGGEPLYRRARRGETVDVPVRSITISDIKLVAYSYPDVTVTIDCSKGTYIRSIARDLGDELGTRAYLHYLLRTSSGTFSLESAWTLDELISQLRPDTFAQMALHPDTALSGGASLILDRPGWTEWYHGRPVPVTTTDAPNQPVDASAYRTDGEWLGVSRRDMASQSWHPRLVVSSANWRSR